MTPAALLANDVPLIDLRAPVEYAQGAFPASVNLPLLIDAERHEVGLAYRNRGREAALAAGRQLVSGAVRKDRIGAWVAFIESHADCWLYCWRGGMRSRIAQEWLEQSGYRVPTVAGGYKRLRRACIAILEGAADDPKRWLVLAGRTGSGKTKVIETLANAIDLEGLARHRGSAFGALPGGQPTPIAFENALAAAYLKHGGRTLVLEDESRTIGRLGLPTAWHQRMSAAPLVLMEVSAATRIRNIRAEYVDQPLAGGIPPQQLQDRLANSLDRIRKRLGGDRHRQIGDALRTAFQTGAHESWIELLLKWYYDPMYDHQLAAKRDRIVFNGERAAIMAYLVDR